MKKTLLSLAVIAFLLAIAHNLLAQGTAFTYQGQLQSNGGAANGNYDFTFALLNTNDPATAQPVGGRLTSLEIQLTLPFMPRAALWAQKCLPSRMPASSASPGCPTARAIWPR